MFGKILRAGKGGHGLKYKIDVQVIQLENLPTTIKKCRVVWSRSAKLQMTDIKDVRGSVASFKQTLTQVTTIYRDKAGKLEQKEYEFKVQVPGKSSSDSPITVGKSVLDMAKYCKDETTTQPAMVPITFKIGTSTTGYLKLSITTIFLGDSNDDGNTEVSGLTGLTSDHGSVREQDLEGFVDEEHSKFSKKARSSKREEPPSAAGSSGRSSSKAEPPRRHKPLPPTAEEEDSDLEDKLEPALNTSKSGRRKSLAARASEIEEAEEDANPFAKKVSKSTPRKVAPKVWEDDEDVSPLNSDISDSEPPPKPKSKAKKAQEPEEPLDDMKASLFATKKPASAAGRGTTGVAGSAAEPSNKASSSKTSKAPPPPLPPAEDEDDDSLRNDLFTAKPKSSAAAANSKSKAAAAAATAGAVAAASSVATLKSKARPPPTEDEEDEDYGPSTSAAQPAAKSRTKTAEVSEAPMTKGSSALGRVGSSKPDISKGGTPAELDQLRQRVAQLEKQLADEQAAKEDLGKKVQKYADKVADLEDQLAEADATELYAEMKEMETRYQAEIKEMETRYQVEIKELMERHLAEVAELEESHNEEIKELKEAASASGVGRGRSVASAEELERLRNELAAQDSLLQAQTAKLEAEQAAAIAAREAAESKLSEANKMIDDSLLVATKHRQENKALQEEVARLKRQLEDASAWDTSAAVAAATAASNNGRRNSQTEAELEELRERIEELEEENARLQKLNVVAQGAAASMLNDIRAVLHDAQGGGDYWLTTGSSALDELAVEVGRLCNAYSRQSSELRQCHDRLTELPQKSAAASARTSASGEPGNFDGALGSSGHSATTAKVKPHELLSRVQQLTAERDSLQDKLASQRQAHADLAAAQASLATANADLAAVQADLAATQADLAAAQLDLGATQADLVTARSEHAAAQRGLAAAQKLVEDLRQEVDRLTFEKEAVERFKVATIADLRKQNDELRSSLRSLSSVAASPRISVEDDVLPAATPQTPGESRSAFAAAIAVHAVSASADGAVEGNWHEFEYLVMQLKADRANLRRQVEQLTADKAALSKQVEELRSSGVAAPVPMAAVSALGESGQLLGSRQPSRDRVAELELQCTELKAQITRLQAQLAELSEADSIIKEWSDYADGLVADKARLEQQVQELTERLANGASANDVRVADAERRMAEWQRRAGDAERKMYELERQVGALQQRTMDTASRASGLERELQEAVSRAQEAERRASATELASVASSSAVVPVPAAQLADTAEVLELRQQIARLESSLSALRMQLMETQSQHVRTREDFALTDHPRNDPWDCNNGKEPTSGVAGTCNGKNEEEPEAGSEAASHGTRTGSGHVDRGWHVELEQLRARNASLEAAVAGLQASLEVVTQQAGQGGESHLGMLEAEKQVQELQSRLSLVLQEKAELESTVVLLRAELERVPLVSHESGVLNPSDSAADVPSVSYQNTAATTRVASQDEAAAEASSATAVAELQQQIEALEEDLAMLRRERSELRSTLKELRLEIQHLEEEKSEVENAVSRLTSDLEDLTEALDASNNENERLSLEVLSLRDQLEQLEARRGEEPASHSQSGRSSKSGRMSSGRGSQCGAPSLPHVDIARQTDAEHDLAALRVAVRDLIRQVALNRQAQDDLEEPSPSGLGDADDLVKALQTLLVQISELQEKYSALLRAPPSLASSNTAAVAAIEAQLAKATTRIEELQALLEDAEIENQHLTEQLEECLTGGRKGPDSVGSAAEECQSSYGGSVAAGATGASNPYSYGHANTLTLSAFEQRLAMVEVQRDELSASLAKASSTNRRLEAEVAALQHELAHTRQGLDSSGSGSLERTPSQVSTRGRASRILSDPEDKKRLEELQAANRKLEAVCDDLEKKAHAAQERAEILETELETAKEMIRGLEASATALQKRMEEEATGASGRQTKEKMADLEARVARLARDRATLEEQLDEERATRKELEDMLKDKLDRAGDDEAAETVAAFEVKYNRLKERYKMLEESSQEEIDELQDQLTEAQTQVTELQSKVKQLLGQVAQGRSAGASGAVTMSSANMEELRNLRSENERLVQQLVSKTMELAELDESVITVKRELARLQEVNRKLAQKATTLEAQAAVVQAGKAPKAKK